MSFPFEMGAFAPGIFLFKKTGFFLFFWSSGFFFSDLGAFDFLRFGVRKNTKGGLNFLGKDLALTTRYYCGSGLILGQRKFKFFSKKKGFLFADQNTKTKGGRAKYLGGTLLVSFQGPEYLE